MPDRLTGPSMLALVGDHTGPTLWRVLQPITALEKQGYPCGWDDMANPAIGAIAPAFDGYLLSRTSWNPEHRRLAEGWFASSRAAGKLVVYDADDDIFTAAETRRRVELNWTDGKSFERLESERWERIWAMQQCDGDHRQELHQQARHRRAERDRSSVVQGDRAGHQANDPGADDRLGRRPAP
jgi:hypothetical protein